VITPEQSYGWFQRIVANPDVHVAEMIPVAREAIAAIDAVRRPLARPSSLIPGHVNARFGRTWHLLDPVEAATLAADLALAVSVAPQQAHHEAGETARETSMRERAERAERALAALRGGP
jgi:hypothetical protein